MGLVNRRTAVREWVRDLVRRADQAEADNRRIRMELAQLVFEKRSGSIGVGLRHCAYCSRPSRHYACVAHMDLAELEGRV